MQPGERSTVGEVVGRLGRRRACVPGEILFLEGDHSEQVYVCVAGRVRVFLTLPSGRELLIGMKVPGEEFGELSAIDGHARSASAAAVDPTVVAVLDADRFRQVVNESPLLSVAVCQSLSAQLRRANDRLATRNSNSAAVRTGRMLVELASMMMRHGSASGAYDVEVTQSDLADWIGATREATARALARFRTAGLIETCRGRIVVLDVVGLDRFVASL
jgi:CRP-like cAMP-binding protein